MSRLRRYVPRRVVRHVRALQQRVQVRAIRRAHAQRTAPPATQLLPVTLVIPVHNDAARLARLLALAQDMEFAQIIVVDDGSDTPVQADNVTLIRHDTPLGPGPARNAALPQVTAPYLVFIDSDDLPTTELTALLADLADAAPFDICLFKHVDSRIANHGHWGQPDWDEAHWRAAGLAIGALREAPRAVWPDLAQTANYPWNKVYRTAFLTDNGIGCADTPVHEDVTLHWLGFLHAKRILTSDRTCVWHMVADGAGRQTNRSGAERLSLFDALAPVVAAKPPADMAVALVRFVLALSGWIRTVLDADHAPAFEAALTHWLHVTVSDWHADIAAADPALLAQITGRT